MRGTVHVLLGVLKQQKASKDERMPLGGVRKPTKQ